MSITLTHMALIKKFVALTIFLAHVPGLLLACESTITLRLENNRGGFYAGQKVQLTSRADGKVYSALSDASGEATLSVPCLEMFDVKIANYTKKMEVEANAGGRSTYTLSYAPDMLQKQKTLAMNDVEKSAVNKHFESLRDTIFMTTSVMPPPAKMDHYAWTVIDVKDLYGKPLVGETMVITGRQRKKNIKVPTDKSGRVLVYLPKGDTYDVNFKHHRNYFSSDVEYTKGTTDIKLQFSYLGTKEVERRMKEEADRIAAEEKRLKEEREAFEKNCASLGLTLEECHRREAERWLKGEIGSSDTVVSHVLKRNKWTDKLIVCDVTGSMDPYTAQVALWYRLNYLSDKNMQFVLFNDGDSKSDASKVIGKTGGIYYSPSKGVDSLDRFMSYVRARGSGGDCPENNMEALIQGVKMTKQPFKELVMIADNNAPVKDISLLPSFNMPVHIILCGADGRIEPDYLKVAWKTKGTIHTIEEDILNLSRLSEGQQIKIGGVTYKIMGGEFVNLSE
jgi:hypothetical protein